MSRIGRAPIAIPDKITIDVTDRHIVVQGPGGKLERDIPGDISVELAGGEVRVSRPSDDPRHRALHGLTRTLIYNMVVGVVDGFTRTLEIQGVGYRAQLQGQGLALQLGFSHPVVVEPPDGISFQVEGNRVHVRGIDKQRVGQVAADIRSLRPPEPYNGKGVRYLGERVRRKAGKAGRR